VSLAELAINAFVGIVDQTVDAAERVVGVAAAPFTSMAWGLAAAAQILPIVRRELGVTGKATGNTSPMQFLLGKFGFCQR